MSQDKDKNLDLDTNIEFEAYVTLFKANHSEPKFPEFSSEWLTRRPKILCEVTPMNNSTENNPTENKSSNSTTASSQLKRFFQPKIYLTAAATVIAVLGVALLVFRSPEVKAPNVSHTGNLKAIVVYVKGDVSRLKSDGSSLKLHTGDILSAGTKIETKGDSLVDITFSSGTMVRLRENTNATLATAVEPNKGIYIEQESGATLHLVRKLESEIEYGSISPTAIASVRGTIYEFTVENNATTVTVAEGMIEATGLKGKTETHIIEADQKIRLSDEHDEPVKKESKNLEIEAKDMQKNATAFNELMSLSDDLENASTEADLKRIYQSEIEFITLRDGRVLRGVVVSQAGGKMLVQTIDGSHFIDESSVQSIRYVDMK